MTHLASLLLAACLIAAPAQAASIIQTTTVSYGQVKALGVVTPATINGGYANAYTSLSDAAGGAIARLSVDPFQGTSLGASVIGLYGIHQAQTYVLLDTVATNTSSGDVDLFLDVAFSAKLAGDRSAAVAVGFIDYTSGGTIYDISVVGRHMTFIGPAGQSYTATQTYYDGSPSAALALGRLAPGASFARTYLWFAQATLLDPLAIESGAADIANATFRYRGETVAAGVPEPGVWALMITGFGLTGSALRRRGLARAS